MAVPEHSGAPCPGDLLGEVVMQCLDISQSPQLACTARLLVGHQVNGAHDDVRAVRHVAISVRARDGFHTA